MIKKPVISVILTAYNHEEYIQQALDGILMQKDCPSFEIIVGDDCSTDGTGKIITEYWQKNKDKMTILPRPKNLGMLKNMKDCFSKCRGDYVAICEGDDYWTDPLKLKKQSEALEQYNDAPMCFTDIKLLIMKTKKFVSHLAPIKKKLHNRVTAQDLISFQNPVGNFSCCMYRREFLKTIPKEYFESKGDADWLLNLHLLDKAPGVFIKDACSVYRILPTGQWSHLSKEKRIMSLLKIICNYNEIFEEKYQNNFLELIRDIISPNSKEQKNKKWREYKTLLKMRLLIAPRRALSFEIKKEKKQTKSKKLS